MDTVGHHSALFIEKLQGDTLEFIWNLPFSENSMHQRSARGARAHMPRAKADRMSQMWTNHGINQNSTKFALWGHRPSSSIEGLCNSWITICAEKSWKQNDAKSLTLPGNIPCILIRNFVLQNVRFCGISARKFQIYAILHVKLPTGAAWVHLVLVLVMVSWETRKAAGQLN